MDEQRAGASIEQRYQQDILSALIKWTIAVGVPVALLNLLGYLADPAWTTPVGSGVVLLLALIAWGCLRLVRRGRVGQAARTYLISAMVFMALIVFIAPKHELVLGAMGLSVFVIMAAFFDPPRAVLRWGMFSAVLYEAALVARSFFPSLDLGLSISVLSLYAAPPIVLLFFALIGRIMTQHLREALLQSESARLDLAQSHAAVERRVEERTHELVAERNRLDATLHELAQARDQADAANHAKSVFLANMSHELRTPLTAILGYSELLQREEIHPGNQQFLREVKAIWSAGQHLLSLVNNILDISKIEADRLDFYIETFDIARMIEDVRVTVHPLIEQHGNKLYIECGNLGVMRADEMRVRQILFNLLSNAAKFTERGTITLRVHFEFSEISAELNAPATEAQHAAPKTQNMIRFEVADTGIGIAPDYLPHLFEKFGQADTSTTRKHGGSGLGLAISQHLCRLMGGDITVANAPGQGTICTVRLPLEVVHPAVAQG